MSLCKVRPISSRLATPDRSSRVVLDVITRDNLRDYLRLKVSPAQERFVASNAVSIAQAHFHPEAWFRGLRAGSTPVGFVMLEDWCQAPVPGAGGGHQPAPEPGGPPEDWKREPYVYLWRFMIDERFQARGFGAQAMRLLIEHARARPGVKSMLLSFVQADGSPEPFYRRMGFERTGEESEGEQVMRLAF